MKNSNDTIGNRTRDFQVCSEMCICTYVCMHVCMYVRMYVYIYTCSLQYSDNGRKKEIKILGEKRIPRTVDSSAPVYKELG
jgi:hypothetical protein